MNITRPREIVKLGREFLGEAHVEAVYRWAVEGHVGNCVLVVQAFPGHLNEFIASSAERRP